MDEEERRSGSDEEPTTVALSDAVDSESVEITKNTIELTSTKSPSTKVSEHSRNSKIVEIKRSEVDEKGKDENDKKSETSFRSRSKCRNRSRDPRRCQKHFREMIGKHESRNCQLERRESDLRKRLEILECSVPAVTVWNIWRMSQGAPISSIQRVIEKQFKGPIEERKIFPSTPSQHYDCRVREVEAERKQAQRRAEEARALWTQKEVALADRKRQIEEARRAQEDREKEVARLEKEAKEARESLERAKGDEVECTEGECGEIKCREIWLNRIGSATSIRSTDLECLTRLQELAETELDLKRQIGELERREYAYMKTLEEADVLWAKMKGDTESSIDSLHEQLEAKILANQELAGRTCQLEDELERMRKQLSTAHSEIKKFRDVKGHDVASGREDDFAGTVGKDITARTDQTDKDVDTGDFIKSVPKEVNVKPQQMNKDTRVADDLFQTSSKAVTAVPDHLDESVGRADDFAPVKSSHTTAAPDQTDKSTKLDDLVHLASKTVTAAPDQTNKSTVLESDLIKVSNKKVTARPNQADQLIGHDTSQVTSSDIAVQEDGDSYQQSSIEPQAPKDIASGRPNDYAKVSDAGGTADQEGIDYAQLLIDMYSDDYGACAPDFICNDEVMSPIDIPLEKEITCPPNIQCDDRDPPKVEETDFTESIVPQPMSILGTTSKHPEFVPAISETIEVEIKEDTSEVQKDGAAKVLTEEPKPRNYEAMDEILLNTEDLDVPFESTGSTGTSKEWSTDVGRDEVVLPRDDLNSSHDQTLRTRGVRSISKTDDDVTESERGTIKQVDITEEGFSGEIVAEPVGRLVVDLPEVRESITSDGITKNINPQAKSAEAAFLPIPETTTVPMTPVMTTEPEFPTDVDSETLLEDAVDRPLELERKDTKDSTRKVSDRDRGEEVPRDTTEIEKIAETGNAASLPETKFHDEVVKDTEPSTREELTTRDQDLDRRYNEVKEDRSSKQEDTIEEDESIDAGPEVKVADETLIPAKEIISEDVEKAGKSSAVEIEGKGEEAAAELERGEDVTEAEKKGPDEADDIGEKNIIQGEIDLGKDKEAAKIDKPAAPSQEVEQVESPKATVKVEPYQVKKEKSRVITDEVGPISDLTEEFEPTEPIDEIKVTEPLGAEAGPIGDLTEKFEPTEQIDKIKVTEPLGAKAGPIGDLTEESEPTEQIDKIKVVKPLGAEAGPIGDLTKESETTEQIDKIKVTKPTLTKNKIIHEEKKKIPIPTVSSIKGLCICKPRTCPLEAARSIKQSPEKPRTICLTVQQRPPRISKISQFFGESKLGSTIRDRKDAGPDSRIRRSRWRGSLRNQSTVTTTGVATQTDSSCIRNRKTIKTERNEARVASVLYPGTLESPSHCMGGNSVETIFSPVAKFTRLGSSDGTDELFCSSCGKSLQQRTSVSVKIIPSVTREKIQDTKSSTTFRTHDILCCACDTQATGEKSNIKMFLVNEKEKFIKKPQSAYCKKEASPDCSTSVETNYQPRIEIDPRVKRKPETRDHGCLVKIPRVKDYQKVQKNNFDHDVITRSKKSDKSKLDSSCGCIEKSTTVDSHSKSIKTRDEKIR